MLDVALENQFLQQRKDPERSGIFSWQMSGNPIHITYITWHKHDKLHIN